jgi:hypothetical protein
MSGSAKAAMLSSLATSRVASAEAATVPHRVRVTTAPASRPGSVVPVVSFSGSKRFRHARKYNHHGRKVQW